MFLNGTYLDLIEKDTPQAPDQTLSGLAFYPAKFLARGGATWKLNSWALTGTVNYLPGETNNQVTPVQKVGSWTTADVSLRYAPVLPGVFSGIHFSVAVLNRTRHPESMCARTFLYSPSVRGAVRLPVGGVEIAAECEHVRALAAERGEPIRCHARTLRRRWSLFRTTGRRGRPPLV